MILAAFTACKKTNDPDQKSIKFVNGENGALTLTEGNSQVIVLEGATLADVTITSSDSTVVAIADSMMIAIKPGNATVTATLKSDAKVTATLQVTVVSFLDGIKFVDMVYLNPIKDWQGQEKMIITMRKMSAELGDNDRILNFDHYGDVADIMSWTDEVLYNNWYILEIRDGDTIGIVMDSISIQRALLLTEDAYYDTKGNFIVNDKGAVMEFTDVYIHNAKGNYITGMRRIVDDVTNAEDQYPKTGWEKQPLPGYIQKSHFNSTNYLAYFTEALSGGSADPDAYPFYNKYDSYFLVWFEAPDASTGETFKYSQNLGHLVSGEFNVVDGAQKIDYVNMKAEIMVEYDNFGLKTEYDEEQGGMVLVQPFEMAGTEERDFVSGQKPAEARANMPISNAALKRMSKVRGTMCAVTRMAFGK